MNPKNAERNNSMNWIYNISTKELFSYWNKTGNSMMNCDFLILDGTQERRYKNYTCVKCGKGFHIGDKGHIHVTKTIRVVYHKECWNLLYH